MNLLITCEHGGNEIPREYRPLFRGSARILASHRGWDPGAIELAKQMAEELDAPLVAATVSRLVVDLNRSLSNPAVFSEWTRRLNEKERERLVAEHYRPYRDLVERRVRTLTARGPVLHIAVHSFTPVLRGVRRTADIGLLYDPARRPERSFCSAWRTALNTADPNLRVRMNYPYRGTSDGMTTALRGHVLPRQYLGIELEINQRLVRSPSWGRVVHAVVRSAAAARPNSSST